MREGMDGLAEMLMGGGRSNGSELKAIAASDLDKGFEPIADLKSGDKVRAKNERYNAYTTTRNGAVIIVHRVGKFGEKNSDSQLYENDFTALFSNEDKIAEFAFDSRRFERVE